MNYHFDSIKFLFFSSEISRIAKKKISNSEKKNNNKFTMAGGKKSKKGPNPLKSQRSVSTTSVIKPKPTQDQDAIEQEEPQKQYPKYQHRASKPEVVPKEVEVVDPIAQMEAERNKQVIEAERLEAQIDMKMTRNENTRIQISLNRSIPTVVLSPRQEALLFDFLKDKPKTHLAGQSGETTDLLEIYIWLQKLGFPDADVEYGMRKSMSSDLDQIICWLCMNLPLHGLPDGFADKLLHQFDDMTLHSPRRLKKEYQPANIVQVDLRMEGLATAQPAVLPTPSPRRNKQMPEEVKTWVLQKIETESTDSDDMSDLEANTNHLGRKVPKVKFVHDEFEIQELRESRRINSAEPFEDHFDSGDLNQLYPSPQPQPVIQTEVANDVEVLDLEDAVEEAVTEPEPKPDILDDNTSVEDIDNGVIGNIFDETNDDSTIASTHKTIFPRDMSCGKWTGRMPINLMQQWLHKNCKDGKILFSGPHQCGRGFRASMKFSGCPTNSPFAKMRFQMTREEIVVAKADAKQYVALKGFYHLAKDLSNQVRTIPPVWADLWKEWNDAEILGAQREAYSKKKRCFEFIHDLKSDIESLEASNEKKRPASVPKALNTVKSSNKTSPSKSDGSHMVRNFKNRTEKKKYKELHQIRSALPVFQYRSSILETIGQHQVVVLSGETGSGKSTQVPSMILEHAIESGVGNETRIICTQPRRISAISLANRVGDELGDSEKDGLVGFLVRLEKKVSASTRITFCTTGVLLRQMESDPTLSGASHIIVDEVHERSLDSDFLLFLLKRLVTKRPNLKIILMSATANAELFAKYFETGTGIKKVPCISVPGKTFPVNVMYLEDAVELSNYRLEPQSEFALREVTKEQARRVTVSGAGGRSHQMTVVWSKTIRSDSADDIYEDENDENDDESTNASNEAERKTYKQSTIKTVARINPAKVNYELIEQLIEYVISQDQDPLNENGHFGSILVFLPGFAEIRRMNDTLVAWTSQKNMPKLWILCLHSSLTGAEQSRVFEVPPNGMRKIILSTNVAETGITIPDVVCVIDTVRAREVCFDKQRNMTRLSEVLISKANCKQRAGRAGRVRPGICFHLVPQATYEKLFASRPPEMLRLGLEELCLRARSIIGTKSVAGRLSALFKEMIEPPPSANVTNSIALLQLVQAFDENENITKLGSMLVNLPLDIRLGKMLLYAAYLGCLDAALTVCSVLSLGKSPLIRPTGFEAEAIAAHKIFQQGFNSDLFVYVNAYDQWSTLCKSKSWRGARALCETNYLSWSNLNMIQDTRSQLERNLRGLVRLTQDGTRGEVEKMLPFAFIAALYPNILILDRPLQVMETGAKSLLHLPGQSQNIRIHRHSMFNISSMEGPLWFTYFMIQLESGLEKTNTMKKATVFDLNEVPGLAVLLLGGRHVRFVPRQRSVVLDDNLVVNCSPRTAACILGLRQILLGAFEWFLGPSDKAVEKEISEAVQYLKSFVALQ